MKQAVCAIIKYPNGNFLGVSRKDNHDDIGLPGGMVEDGESLTDAVKREVLEETGYRVNVDGEFIFSSVDKDTQVYTFMCSIINTHKREGIKECETGIFGFFPMNRFIENSSFSEYNKRMFEAYEYYLFNV